MSGAEAGHGAGSQGAAGGRVDRAVEWVYGGVWGVLASLFNVPREAPELPALGGVEAERFRPSPNYLAMQKMIFWIAMTIVDVAIVIGWIVIAIVEPIAGALLLLPALALAILPDIIAYVALHLRYDTMWYVMNERSIRIRRGVWVIQETTITFENIQNVTVTQGPVQRWFGVATVVIQTAGGGGGVPGQPGGGGTNMGLIEGVADAPRLRDLFLAKMKVSRGAGLGDERGAQRDEERAEEGEEARLRAEAGVGSGAGGWTPAHIIALREMLEEARRANAAVG